MFDDRGQNRHAPRSPPYGYAVYAVHGPCRGRGRGVSHVDLSVASNMIISKRSIYYRVCVNYFSSRYLYSPIYTIWFVIPTEIRHIACLYIIMKLYSPLSLALVDVVGCHLAITYTGRNIIPCERCRHRPNRAREFNRFNRPTVSNRAQRAKDKLRAFVRAVVRAFVR